LYGIHVGRGDIDLDATLAELDIDDITPYLTPIEKTATIRDLLLSRSGIYHEAAGESQSMIDLRPERGSHPPGTYFYYNNRDFNALGEDIRAPHRQACLRRLQRGDRRTDRYGRFLPRRLRLRV
jgi:CubicO group peptidase (beta-lactamase class C family)